ncbi:TPA: hypothetical protein ACV5FF_003809 [Enterobacter hormaechei subsp. steigerwaltii]|jgi:hypothetical protein|uniref:hypothetical protein n=1 Tax=Enterobacter hormaechei TaxID=158836 RepID=UPI0005EF089F|nr:hypothetical protein [Enterobacter hormaechei]KJP73597.1 hypothetical protein SR76_10305 [Enterobacter hormaechei subsp. steigerwaltii]MBG0538388.1 hypothetical protein [Enterobacter hormaechei]MXS05560.1 hypothetical protein [Enterobacter hormaechei]HAV1742515.1 hypothetical protein [Enterobacter hormaechei subsp. steigerwaltii]HCK7230742.1 hypothetical protein [Enterobacter hormaechei]
MKPHYLNDLHANEAADDIIGLLKLCQQLQSEKDGRERPAPGAYSRDEDAFADRIRTECGHARQLRRLLPVMTTLSATGAGMERRGEISVLPGEDYAQKAPARLTVQYLSSGDNKQ